MSSLLVDTNVVSYLMRQGPLSDTYRPLVAGHEQVISFMTAAELFEGAYRARWGGKRWAQLKQTLSDYLVLPSSAELCQWWGWVRWERRLQPISVDDAWIAATALAYDLPLVTHNPADFQDIPDLRLITAAAP